MNENAFQDKADVDDVYSDAEAGRGRFYLLGKTNAGRVICTGPLNSEADASELGLKLRSYSIFRVATRDLAEAKRQIRDGQALEVANL